MTALLNLNIKVMCVVLDMANFDDILIFTKKSTYFRLTKEGV